MKTNSQDLRSVMLIEDDPVHNFITENTIKVAGFVGLCYIHSTARSALEFLKNLLLIKDYEKLIPKYIFLDLYLPSMDGFQFIRAFHELPEELQSIRIVILTVSLNPEDEAFCRKYDRVVAFYQKPITQDKLKKLSKNGN